MLCSSWVTTTKVMPRPFESSRIVWSRPADVIGSRPGRGLVEKEDAGIERHRPGDPRALLHAAGQRRRLLRGGGQQARPGSASPPRRASFSSAPRSVNSSSGRQTFSSTVIEPKSAPLWYMTPNLRSSRRRSSPSAVTMSSPSKRIRPAAGGGRARSCVFSSELFPHPDPPRMTKTSPRRTSK